MNPTILLLLVEDEELIQSLLEESLSEEGFELVIARNGTEALAELDADASRFRAVLTDIDLGPGPSGWDVARHARKLRSDIPVVYMSGKSAADWTAEGVPRASWCPSPL